MRYLRYALLGLLALGALLVGGVQHTGAEHVPFWVHEVNDGGSKSVPGASFWGFVSCRPNPNPLDPCPAEAEDFDGPFDDNRQGQLDPVNLIFFTSDSSPALDVAASALLNSGWTTNNPCPVESANLFAYFEGAAAGKEQDLHLYSPVAGCFEKFHIRLFEPVVDSSWAIAAVHHECALLAQPFCLTDTVFGWEDAEDLVKEDLVPGDVIPPDLVVDNWTADLGNTALSEDCPKGGWRSNAGDDVCNDGVAEVFELTCPPSLPIVRVSVDSVCGQGNLNSLAPTDISADGRFVAFASFAGNLVEGEIDTPLTDIYVYDRQMGLISRVSVRTDGTEPDGQDLAPTISADGRYVAFQSNALDLVPADSNHQPDVFVHDRVTGTTTRVSVSSSGIEGNHASGAPSISADGRYVAFESSATNLVSGDTNERADIFVRDRDTGETTRVNLPSPSCSTCGTEATGFSGAPRMGADGRYVLFGSDSILVPNKTTPWFEVYVRDTCAGAGPTCTPDTIRVSDPSPYCSACGSEANGGSGTASISSDGRYVAFTSAASNLIGGDTNSVQDVFVRDRDVDEDGIFDEPTAISTVRVSVDSDGNQGGGVGGACGGPCAVISTGGRYVVFESNSILVPDKTTPWGEIYVHDRVTAITARVSVAPGNTEPNQHSGGPSISADGRYVAFTSSADNLVGGDTNFASDAFVHNLGDSDADGLWNPFDPCPNNPDCDGDTVLDGQDNCPLNFNSTQTNTDFDLNIAGATVNGLALRGDPDGDACDDDDDNDGFTDIDENFMGTLPLDHCADSPTADDEGPPDAWPFDFNDDQRASLGDALRYIPVFNTFAPGPPYDQRFDLNGDGGIGLGDVLKYIPVINKTCTP